MVLGNKDLNELAESMRIRLFRERGSGKVKLRGLQTAKKWETFFEFWNRISIGGLKLELNSMRCAVLGFQWKDSINNQLL